MGKAEIPRRQSINSQEKFEMGDDEFQTLPKEKCFSGGIILHINGFWCPESLVQSVISFQKQFRAQDDDILLATLPKAGTTWLKALVFSIVNRYQFKVDQSPLLTSNPHLLVPFEYQLYGMHENHDLEGYNIPFSRRIFATHIRYEALPPSIFDAKCRIVYLCRNPLDQFVSQWHFLQQNAHSAKKPIELNEAFELFLQGRHIFGPIWDQIIGYWNASLNNPEKVLFLKYEDLKKDNVSSQKKIAEFLGVPFSKDEEENDLIEEITKLCSFKSLSGVEVNKSGILNSKFPVQFSSYFRKGEVGDWANYLTPHMVARATRLIEEKFGESGLTFEFI